MKKQQFNIQVPNTSENRASLDLIQQWSQTIPTLFFLDICTISHIKKSLAFGSNGEFLETKLLASLRNNDLPHNGISYLPALIEKASDANSKLCEEWLKQEVVRDLTALKEFFKQARVEETIEIVTDYISNLKGIHPELLGHNYLEFLSFVNGMRVFNTIERTKRFKVAQTICKKAASLDIYKGHPLILASLACIYGCVAAKKVLKFKADPAKFNPSNALGDVQTIQRIGQLTRLIEKNKTNYIRTQFVTDDRHLQDFYKFFFINEVISEEGDDFTATKYEMTIQANMLFPDLFSESGAAKGETEDEEILKIYTLVGFPVD